MANATKSKKRRNKQPITHSSSWLRFSADLKKRGKWKEEIAGNQGLSDMTVAVYKGSADALLQAAEAALHEGQRLRKQR